jgi:hypothetical protein
MKLNRLCAAVPLLLSTGATALAADINNLQSLSQTEFRLLSEDLGAALSYKPLVPTAPLGFPGFDVSVAATGTHLKHADLLQRATNSSDSYSTLVVPTVRASVGLPLNLDASVMYSAVPKTGAKLFGGALAWAFVSGNTALPAIGLRGSYTRTTGIDQLDFSTAGLDASLSKGFGFITPYIGAGRVWISSDPISTTGLHSESLWLNKGFAGLSFKLTVVHLDLEWDRTGVANSYGAKLGLRF